LRVRWGRGKLHRGKSRRGKQHETKFCHDDLGSRKILARSVVLCRRRLALGINRWIRPDCGGFETQL
jgi:hypothetical protein